MTSLIPLWCMPGTFMRHDEWQNALFLHWKLSKEEER